MHVKLILRHCLVSAKNYITTIKLTKNVAQIPPNSEDHELLYKTLDDKLVSKAQNLFCAIMRDHYVHFSKECT